MYLDISAKLVLSERIFRRPFVKRFAPCYRTCYRSVLSVCDVGVLWPNGGMDQDAIWYGGRPRPRRHCVRWGPSSPTERGTATASHFSALVYCGQTVAHLSYCWALVDIPNIVEHRSVIRVHNPTALSNTTSVVVWVVEHYWYRLWLLVRFCKCW